MKSVKKTVADFPELAAQWHPTMNGDLKPSDVTSGSNKKVWWKCEKGHEWNSNVSNRMKGFGRCKRCSRKNTCLATTHPELASQWHPAKNGSLTPEDLSATSSKKVWWICEAGHEWHAIVNSRKQGHRCGKCARRVVCLENCLATTHPEIAKQWHPTKNGDLTPEDVVSGSNKKVWWMCKKGHESHAPVIYKSKNRVCIKCTKANTENCLATTHPEIAKQWHPTKNGSLTPEDVVYGSSKKVWWLCENGHDWDATVGHRSNGTGCRICCNREVCLENCLATTHPELAAQWHPTKNGNLTPKDVISGSEKKVWWVCENGHEWDAVIVSRKAGCGCRVCSNNEVCESNCLSTTHPELASQWHPTNNGSLTPKDVINASSKKVWWVCENGHEWDASIHSRKRGCGCRICANKEVCLSNCLATTHPELASQWHPTKNGSLTPKDVTSGTCKKVWWLCENGHEVDSLIRNRIKGHGCRKCSGHEATPETCLAKTHPKLAVEWHPTMNGNLTPNDVKSGSGKKVWWVCKKGHSWEAKPCDRKRGNGCPDCRESRGEKKIVDLLGIMALPFKREIKFKKCRSQKELPFDFIVKLPNGKGVLIEYQGIQHYKPIRRSHSWTKKKALCKFKAIQERDKIKAEWARKNKIPLLVIPYWEYDNIPRLIEDFVGSIKN